MAKSWLMGVAAAALIAAGDAEAADLTLKRVLLSTGGVGLYEYEVDVDGDASVEWNAPRDQIDDILKSVVVFDDHGGVGGLDLAGPKSLDETFRALPFAAKDLQSTPALLTALRGAEVEVGGARALKGRIVAVNEETEATPDGTALTTRHRVTVMTDSGLESFVLEQADSVRFADPAVREAIGRALTAVAADSERGARLLRLTSHGEGKRKLHVAYLAAAPVWKVSYRLVLGAPKANLQGWATLENFSGQDWSGVDLTLVSGRPVSYRQALYRAYRVERPEAPVDIGAALAPEVDRGDMAVREARSYAPKAAAAPMRGVLMAAPPAPALAAGAERIAARDEETQVSFHLPQPVSLANGRSLSLPIVDAEPPVSRVAIFDPRTDARHPMSAAELVNDGAATLPPGVVTIYENAENGATYVGDSRLSATHAGEKRMLPYALDQKTTIAEDDSDSNSLARAALAKGVLTLDELTRNRAIYRVRAAEPVRLMVVTPKLEGGKLAEPGTAGVTEAEGRYRVPFDVKAGEQSFAVTQERTDTRLVELAELDGASLSLYAKSGEIDPATRASLEKLAALRAAEAEAERELAAAQSRIDAVTTDQTRIKDLLAAAPVGSDLAKRYLGKLDADETELEALNKTKAKRETARDQARKTVAEFIAGQ
jgi:hypothetical protein